MNPSKILNEKEHEFCIKLLKLFKIDGKSADQMITPGQLDIFGVIVLRKKSRVQILTSTQYGKSLIVALACIILTCVEGEIVSIPAPTEDKAKIIMRYYIQHLGDHPLFYSMLEKEDKVDKLMMETSKDRLILKNRGGVFILSVQAGNSQKGFQAAMGEGSKIVIEDESGLIPDNIEATIFRMIAGKKDAMYVKIGNPFYRNHFYKSSKDERYLQIFIDFKQGLREGRYDYDFIEEARTKPNFDILFGCKFPEEDSMGADGYMRLLTDAELANTGVKTSSHSGFNVLAVDPAAGGDNSTIVLKSANQQEVLFDQKLDNTMDLVGVVHDCYRAHNIAMVMVDATGIGQGVYDRLKEMGLPMMKINFAEKADDPDTFYNKKAELYWKQRQWLLSGGKLVYNKGWTEFEYIKYRVRDGRIFIQQKEELFKQGLMSPNCVDAAVMTQAISANDLRTEQQIKNRIKSKVWYDETDKIWQNK